MLILLNYSNFKNQLSFLNCDKTARIPNQVQSDIGTVVDDDDADNNECDPDFAIPFSKSEKNRQETRFYEISYV